MHVVGPQGLLGMVLLECVCVCGILLRVCVCVCVCVRGRNAHTKASNKKATQEDKQVAVHSDPLSIAEAAARHAAVPLAPPHNMPKTL